MSIINSSITTSKQRGFTLIELLLYVAIVGSLLIAISLFMALTLDARVKNQTITEVEQQGAAAIDYITQTIRNASAITTPAAGASGASITITVPSSSLSPTVFSVTNGVLYVTEGANAAIALTNGKVNVSGINFTNLTRPGTNGIAQISITLSRQNPGGKNEYDYQKTFVTSAGIGR